MLNTKSKIATAILTVAILCGLFYARYLCSFYTLKATYVGDNVYESDNGHLWEYETTTQLPKGTRVVLKMFDTDAGYETNEVVSVEIQ